MTTTLFAFPPQTAFGRIVPKAKIVEHSKTQSGLRHALTNDIEQINWAYKLAPETLHIDATDQITEIQVFQIKLKKRDVAAEILYAIDKAIPFPIVFELHFDGNIKSVAIPKRRSEADSHKWVSGEMLESAWQPANAPRQPLPMALNMQKLYEAMLRIFLPIPSRNNESLKEQLERWGVIRQKERDILKLQAQLGREKQFNRKVDINNEMKKQQAALLLLKSGKDNG